MVESLQSAPHFFLTALIDVTDLLALRVQINEHRRGRAARLGERPDRQGERPDPARHPEVNVSFAGDKILKKKRIHVGIAVPTERGLTVLAIRDTDQKASDRSPGSRTP